MAPHSSSLACRIPGTGEPGGLPSMGLHRVGHHWSDLAAAAGIKRDICLWSDHRFETEILRRTKRDNTKHLYCPSDEKMKSGRKQCSWMYAKSFYVLVHHAQSCLTVCNPMDCSPPGSSVHGNFQARILDCVAILFSRGSSRPRDQNCVSCVSCIAGKFFTSWVMLCS